MSGTEKKDVWTLRNDNGDDGLCCFEFDVESGIDWCVWGANCAIKKQLVKI